MSFRVGYVYTIHFDRPIHHARHYSGCTQRLRERLATHAMGRGARLLQVCRERGIGWRLGGLTQVSLQDMRAVERLLKRQHEAGRYCQLCQDREDCRRLPDSQPLSLDLIPWPTDSVSLEKWGRGKWEPEVRFARPTDPPKWLEQIASFMRHERGNLGFIPIGPRGLSFAKNHRRMILGIVRGQLVSYLGFSANKERVTIQQTVTADEVRCCGLGRMMVRLLSEAAPKYPLTCWVREDLPANEFWRRLGFEGVAIKRHKTSGRTLIQYELPAGHDWSACDQAREIIRSVRPGTRPKTRRK